MIEKNKHSKLKVLKKDCFEKINVAKMDIHSRRGIPDGCKGDREWPDPQ